MKIQQIKEKNEEFVEVTGPEESVKKADADGIVNELEGGEVVSFAEFGDEEKAGEALLVSLTPQ